ncbi:probable transcription factor At5g61620 [Mercurialis annua]|uniref:probable transcription factor At5g61620 n=1 Tax=Mercurialis annua TaxID=3986 RepID=UPI00215E4685|nr:probable transcription factor At5g61620 [Mercurialis annua]
MVREMAARKCSHCGLNGHNSRTCSGGKTGGCLKLFGVKINEQTPIKKSVSLGNLGCLRDDNDHHDDDVDDGYVSDSYIGSKKYKAAHERKKGTPWSEEEHRIFLEGLHKLGKGDWRGISKNFVTSRTPTQVASHAQKFFLRHAATDKKKRRTSLFDMNLIESVPASHPKEVPILPANKSALLLKKPAEIPSNATTTPDQVVSRFPRLCLDNPTPKANHSYTPGVPVPSYAGMPYMVGFSGSKQSYWAAKSIPTASYLHMVNYNYPTVVYPFTSGNFSTCAPITAHPSGIPTPRSFPVNYSQGGSSSTSTTRNEDPLELKISLSCQSPRDHTRLQGLLV